MSRIVALTVTEAEELAGYPKNQRPMQLAWMRERRNHEHILDCGVVESYELLFKRGYMARVEETKHAK